jgi:hypothetical protein
MVQFMHIFRKRPETIVFELKRRSFLLQQEQQLAEEALLNRFEVPEEVTNNEESAVNSSKSLTQNPLAGKATAVKELLDEAEEVAEDERDGESESFLATDDEDEQEYSAGEEENVNDMAYKSVQIDQGLMHEELNTLRKITWEIQEQVESRYDFGLVQLDCRKYRKRLLAHCQALIDQLEEHVRSDFLHRMTLIKLEKDSIQKRVDAPAGCIDDVIMLLDFIDSLQTDTNKIDEIHVLIDKLTTKMDGVEHLEILFKGGVYLEFLHIRNWPRSFTEFIERRRTELMSRKENLFKEMNNDISHIHLQISRFEATVTSLLEEGLVPADHGREAALYAHGKERQDQSGSDSSEGEEDSGSASESPAPKNALITQPDPRWSKASGFTFIWFAEEIGLKDWRFEQGHIEKTFLRIEQLKAQFDEV